MTWLQPWAAWFLAGLPLIVLLYLLKVRRQPVTVSTLLFWKRVLEEHRRRALFQKLRHVLSLLLWLLIFALIVAAIARPSFDRLIREGASTVILLDTRARMQAVEADGESRWVKARRGALHAVAQVSGNRPMALIAVGPGPTVLSPFTSDERSLRLAVEKAAVTDATGTLAEALELADALLATRGGSKQIVLYSDRVPDQQTMRRYPSLVANPLGTQRENAAILRFATRPLPASPQTSEILVELANFGSRGVTTSLEIRYDDRLLDVKPVTLAAGARETHVFPTVPRPSGTARGHLLATLTTDDALALDNTARAMLPPPRALRILLITKGNAFIEKALAAEPGFSFELLAPESWTQALSARFDVTVFDDFVPEVWENGNALFLSRTPFDSTDALLTTPVLTDIDATHPVLQNVDLSKATIFRARSLTLPAPSENALYDAPLRSFENALLITGDHREAKRRRVAALGFDLAASDLPLRVAFPILVSNTIHWLAGNAPESRLPLRCGETLRLADGEQVRTSPPVTGYFQPLQNGFYEALRNGRREWLAVNTSSEEESDLRLPTARETGETRSLAPLSTAAAAWIPVWPPWRYLALAAVLLATTEWSLFNRRRTE